MPKNFSLEKNNPKADGSEEPHVYEEAHGSEDIHRSEDIHGLEDMHGSEELHGSKESDCSDESDYSEESDCSEDSDGLEESRKSTCKPVVNGQPVEGAPHTLYYSNAWISIFQLCEISIVRSGRKKKKSNQIYGKLWLQHPCGWWQLYNRTLENAETIDVPGVITLTHPTFGILPFVRLWIWFDEMGGGLKGMNNKQVVWVPENPYDKVRTIRAISKDCCIKVSFIAFRRAVLADLEIDLLNIANDEGIYGSITVSFPNKKGLAPLSVFNKKSFDFVRVNNKQPVPLSRPVIAVPYNNPLEINVDLHSVSGAIAQGTITISPVTLGKWYGILENHGEIKVRATAEFCTYYHHHPKA